MPRPRILVSGHTEARSGEFPDAAISLSRRYADAILAAGGLPLLLPATTDTTVVRQALAQCQGVLLTGGDDVEPALYADPLPSEVREAVSVAVGQRDLFEFILIDEAFRQSRAVLAICRGQQLVNVALGGDLIADLPRQRPGPIQHDQSERRFEVVHEVVTEPGSLLARITGVATLGVNSTHHQAVGRVAPPLRATGRSPDGIIEALELAPESGASLPFLLTVQFHPERLSDRHPEHRRIFEAFVGAALAG